MSRIARLLPAFLALSSGGCATTHAPFTPEAALPEADSVVGSDVAPGVRYTFIRHERGPWAIHVLAVDPHSCAPVIDAVKPAPPLSRRAATSTLGDGALAAVNADFFMLPGGTTVGAHVHDGVPIVGPGERPVFGVAPGGVWLEGRARLEAFAHERDDSARVVQINRIAPDGLSLLTSWLGDTLTADSAALVMTLSVLGGDEGGGRAVVVEIDSTGRTRELGAGRAALHGTGPQRDWIRRRAVGDTITWKAEVRVEGVAAEEVVGGFPTLLRNDSTVLAAQTVNEAFGMRRHPRTAVGWTPGGTLLLVVVDGRQPGWSDGMTLPKLTWLFQRLGAANAINLDGGGSSAMVVRGRIVNRPSDREGERAVGNALVLARCRRP